MVVNLWLSAQLATSFILPSHFFGTPRRPPPRPRPRSKFGLRSSRLAKPCGPACGSLSRRAQRLGSGSKCAATANASLTYIPELYRLIRSLPLISPCGLPRAVYRAASRAAWFYRLPLRAVRLYELEASPSVPALAREVRSLLHWTPSTPDETPCRPPATKQSAR
jgi:hypothetical protein